MAIVKFSTFFYGEKFLQVNKRKRMSERRKMFKMAWNQQIVYGRTTCR
ncbi:hypothetical protein T4B_10845 [Trichinella pseudospiralis]|uniref:Uncharacterized protein n=1 Tax=Trichinella pseudospiralis TaxID=6337 RepID=A0A0V1GD67_TRIPS|nr:hypothetical protein T4B_10845 [Trichinella pseudospiralis]